MSRWCDVYAPAEDFQVTPNVAVLNVGITPFEWIIPHVSSNLEIPSLVGHTANLVENYMIVGFGK